VVIRLLNDDFLLGTWLLQGIVYTLIWSISAFIVRYTISYPIIKRFTIKIKKDYEKLSSLEKED